MKKYFVLWGEPTGKGRPRFMRAGCGVRTYTPEKTANYETLIKLQYMHECERYMFPDKAMIKMAIKAYYQIPKSASKKSKKKMEDGITRPTKKPDCDNVMKIVADSLNGIAYRDDSQIVECVINKYYSEAPRIEVEIENIEENIQKKIS